MRIVKLQAYIFTAALFASFLPWALKPLAVFIAYTGLLFHHPLRDVQAIVFRSLFVRLTFAYWATLMLSAILNSSPIEQVAAASISILVVPMFALVAALPEDKQRQVLSALICAAFVYTFIFAATFDWSQFLNPEYRGDQDVDVFVALNSAFICIFAVERLLFSRQRLLKWVLLSLALYGFLVVLLIKSRGTLAAIVLTVTFLYFYRIATIRSGRATFYVISLFGCGLAAIGAMNLDAFVGPVSELLHLSDEGARNLSTGSGRMLVWEYALLELWPEKFWFGYGPNANLELISQAFLIHGAHNVLFASVVDGGLMAAIPILSILVLPLLLFRRISQAVFGYHFYFLALAAALNESLLYTFGTPFAWATLAMFAQLTDLKRRK